MRGTDANVICTKFEWILKTFSLCPNQSIKLSDLSAYKQVCADLYSILRFSREDSKFSNSLKPKTEPRKNVLKVCLHSDKSMQTTVHFDHFWTKIIKIVEFTTPEKNRKSLFTFRQINAELRSISQFLDERIQNTQIQSQFVYFR